MKRKQSFREPTVASTARSKNTPSAPESSLTRPVTAGRTAPGLTTPGSAPPPVDYEDYNTGNRLKLGKPGSAEWMSPEVQGFVHPSILKRLEKGLEKGEDIAGRSVRKNKSVLTRCLWADIDKRMRSTTTWSDQTGPCDWCNESGGDRQCAVMLDEETILIKTPPTGADFVRVRDLHAQRKQQYPQFQEE